MTQLTRTVVLAVLAAIALACAPAAAVEDTFWVVIDGDGQVADGGGTGYGDGQWYFYEGSEWTTQWFYNAPFSWDRYKVIDLRMEVVALDEDAFADITINWADPEWSLMVPPRDCPPLPPMDEGQQELYIRVLNPSVFKGDIGEPVIIDVQGILIPDYNPEWVSIDIYGNDFEILSGCIRHTCVPEPATLGLIGLGLGALLLRLRRRSK